MSTDSTTRQGHNEAVAPYKQEVVLRTQYVEEERSGNELAAEYDVSPATIYYWLRKHGITRRNPKRQTQYTVLGPDEREDLRRLYVDERLSAREIAEEYDCSIGTVYNRLQEFDIETHPPLPEATLVELYVDRGDSMQAIADELECSRTTVRNSLAEHDLIDTAPTQHAP